MAELKTKPTNQSAKSFINSVEDPQKREDCFAIARLMEEATGFKPKMWGTSIVGFGSYHYKYASGQEGDWPLIGFSPRKQNLPIYIMAGFDQYDELMAKLGKHKTAKSCLYIKKLADLNISTLKKLIKESVKHMSKLQAKA